MLGTSYKDLSCIAVRVCCVCMRECAYEHALCLMITWSAVLKEQFTLKKLRGHHLLALMLFNTCMTFFLLLYCFSIS